MATKTKKTTRTSKSVRTKRTAAQSPAMPRQEKPVFRMGTLIAVILFAALVFAAVYMNRQAETALEEAATPAAEDAFLFTQDSLVTSIEVKPLEGDTVKLERSEENAWALTQPKKTEADQGLAEAAATQIAALRIITEVDGVDDPSIFGLDTPAYVVTIGFEGGETGMFEVGDMTPSETGYYVRMDGKYYVTTLSGISALTSLTVSPPYLIVEATPAP